MIKFDPCFDPNKIRRFRRWIKPTLKAFEQRTEGKIRWPKQVRCMNDEEIEQGERRGKGHGLYSRGTVKINPYMSWKAIYLNFIHELFHHVLPGTTDEWINEVGVPEIYRVATGRTLR